MKVHLHNAYTFHHELRSQPDASGIPLASENVTGDLAALIDEAYTSSVLAEQFSGKFDQIDVEIKPHWLTEPSVEKVEIRLSARGNGTVAPGDTPIVTRRRFDSGPWVRSVQKTALRLHAEGTLAQG